MVVGSWYGSKPASLKLDLEFHRSNLNLLVSQVSSIPATLSHRWTKARRFGAAWASLRELMPGEALTTLVCSLEDADSAFARLQSGEEIAVVFSNIPVARYESG